ncbi:MAG: glycosyltransferase [Prevotella sp.]|nr:glycosyltransferase [Prevotella sp.]
MFVSVYAIAKNEESLAVRWYENFKEADEICVLVNNSTDNTARVLRKLGVKVKVKDYSRFRFDVARNEAMQLCSKKADLLFACDMDDTIEAGWKSKIEHAWELGKATGKNPNSILFTYSVWYGDNVPKQKFLRHSIHTPSGWYWKNRVHEYLEGTERKSFIYYPRFEMESRPTKQEHGQYLPLLEEECAEPNCEARTKHLLAREYLTNKRYEEAIEWFQKHLESIDATWKPERAASMKFMSDCYGFLGFDNAKELWLWKAMNEDLNDRDSPFILGKLLISKKEYRSAIDVLNRCISIEEPELDYPYYTLEAWTELPYLCLAEAKYYVGDWEGAIQDIDKALAMNPRSILGMNMKKEISNIIASGGVPPRPPADVPRNRIEIKELL